MELVNKLEVIVSEWYKKAPRLPKNGRDWLAKNVWWLALIGVVLGGFAVFALIGTTFLGASLLTAVGGTAGLAIGGLLLVGVIVSLAFSVLMLVITGLAISPLKDGKKRGWDLLFLSLVLEALSLAASFIFSFNILSLIWGALWLAVIGYFLFEIKSHFVRTSKAEPKVTV